MRRQIGLSTIHLLLLAATAAGSTACDEEFRDEPFGALDLASAYDGGTARDPVAGLPTQIDPVIGYLDGERAEYYDFGPVPAIRSDGTGTPTAVKVQPMYFFFTPDGVPLMSRPVREARDGTDWIRGGKRVLDPNPKDFCADATKAQTPCSPENLARARTEKTRPYAIRQRDVLIDPIRGSADYQRPIVDVTPADLSVRAPQYTGLWEIIEITAPRGYEPDDIKHASTLDSAVASGRFKKRATGKVINCPIVDERTYVSRGVTDRPTPRPRIELWYRRKLTACFLANGWETIGNERGELFFAGQDAERLDTFDVARLAVGQGKSASSQLVVPIGRAYVPAIFTSDQSGAPPSVTRIVDNLITVGRPRRFRNDPPGYTPIRWMHDLPAEPNYRNGALRSIEEVDPSHAVASAPALVRNMPLRGIAEKCTLPRIPKSAGGFNYEVCGREVPNPEDPGGPRIVDARGDARCNAVGLECNKDTCYCDAPFVGYGQACGPGIAQCNPERDALSENGYTCFPPWGGHCYARCAPATQMNTRTAENMDKKPTEILDSRCREIPGYACLPYQDAGICIRFCDQNVTMGNQCSAAVTVSGESRDLGAGQRCEDWGIQICSWPEDYTGND